MTNYLSTCFFLISVLIVLITSQESCISPLGETRGKCGGWRDCPVLQRIIDRYQQGNPSQEVKSFLRKSVCPTTNTLCCPDEENKPINTNNQPSRPSGKSLLPNNCGMRHHSDGKIVGGKDAKIGAWPWIVLIYGRNEFRKTTPLCGGSLINDRYVVTAAHCMVDEDLTYVSIGEHTIGMKPDCGIIRGRQICAPDEQNIEIERSISHPKYNNPCRFCNDIGLIRLAKKVHIDNEFVIPICLPFNLKEDIGISFHELNGYEGKVAGWGRTGTSDSSDVLQEVLLLIQELNFCQKEKRRFDDPNKIICAGGHKAKDSCAGDSGGPLTLNKHNIKFFLVGITSYGHRECATIGAQGIYTNVNHYVEWIVNNLKP